MVQVRVRVALSFVGEQHGKGAQQQGAAAGEGAGARRLLSSAADRRGEQGGLVWLAAGQQGRRQLQPLHQPGGGDWAPAQLFGDSCRSGESFTRAQQQGDPQAGVAPLQPGVVRQQRQRLAVGLLGALAVGQGLPGPAQLQPGVAEIWLEAEAALLGCGCGEPLLLAR